MIPHRHTPPVQKFVTHVMKLSWKSRDVRKQVLKWLKRAGKGDWLGGFVVVRGEAG